MRTFLALLLTAGICLAGDLRLGKPLGQAKLVEIAAITAAPGPYVGQVVQVKGKITEVCQNMGCWTMLVDPSGKNSIRVKVKDGEIVFPKDAVGKTAVAEGKLVKLELTKEQAAARARHEAEENGKPFDPSKVKGPVTIYQIQGTGAVISD